VNRNGDPLPLFRQPLKQPLPSPPKGTQLTVTLSGETLRVLSNMIGTSNSIGVECLSGSGAIASIFIHAFRVGYTVLLVSGHTVSIRGSRNVFYVDD
jgi:hypothetical protein